MGGLAGHAVGNLLIVALWDLLGDTVAGLDWVGRLLGTETLPAAQGTVSLPVLAARATHAVAAAARPEDADLGHDWALPGRFVLPDGIWDDLDDEHTYVETRPYYFALGQAEQDASTPSVYDNPLDLNVIADAVRWVAAMATEKK